MNSPRQTAMQKKFAHAAVALRTALDQLPEPAFYYMRENHTFRKLSSDPSTALAEIENEFNAGYTFGSLFSNRKGFPGVHATGSANRLSFFSECKSVLESWMYPKPARKPFTDDFLRKLYHIEEFELLCDFEEFKQIARAIEAAHVGGQSVADILFSKHQKTV